MQYLLAIIINNVKGFTESPSTQTDEIEVVLKLLALRVQQSRKSFIYFQSEL